jgi:hypothetical protein
LIKSTFNTLMLWASGSLAQRGRYAVSQNESQSNTRITVTLAQLRAVKEQGQWAAFAASLLSGPNLPSEAIELFGTYWIEAGHHIREQIGDDHLLVCLLRHLLPAFAGESIELFRGENRDRWQSGTVGLAWSKSAETARMFASGLNAVVSGGVLLKCSFEPEAIISGPNAHSISLGENQFTVDPYAITTISALELFPVIT